MDENGEILLLHASKNNTRPFVLPCAQLAQYTLLRFCIHFHFGPYDLISRFVEICDIQPSSPKSSVTRLGNLLDFGQILIPLSTINLSKSPTFLGNFCKGVKIYHFSSEILFGQLL